MQLGVSSYSFSQAKLGVFDTIKVVKELGFDVIEFAGFPQLPPGETPLSFAPRVKEACDAAGLRVANYTIGADFLKGSGGDWRAEAERLKDEVRVAKALGCSGMRHDATWGFPPTKEGARGFDQALPVLAQGCRAVTEFAAELGIKTMVENHGYFAQDSDRVEKLINAVDHPNFGLLLDMGNFLCVDENPAQAVGKLLPYVFHVHAKDFHYKPGSEADPGEGWFPTRGGNYLRGAIVGHGVVPIVQCLRLLKAKGYDGVLSIEFEGMEDPVKGVRSGLANLRRYLDALEQRDE
ncbi:MAG: sugar phosphate isomerase/epimerase [Firmicutes bacterium]|nr:sugar phosphate isomerase/epimerase [Bacillota bacterium]